MGKEMGEGDWGDWRELGEGGGEMGRDGGSGETGATGERSAGDVWGVLVRNLESETRAGPALQKPHPVSSICPRPISVPFQHLCPRPTSVPSSHAQAAKGDKIPSFEKYQPRADMARVAATQVLGSQQDSLPCPAAQPVRRPRLPLMALHWGSP